MRQLGLVVLLAVGCHEPVELGSIEQQTVSLYPSSHDFGQINVNASSAAVTLQITPYDTTGYDTVSSITEGCPDFTIDAPGLPADVYRTCTTCTGEEWCTVPAFSECGPGSEYHAYFFSATFKPSVAGPQSCVVTISLNNGGGGSGSGANIRQVTLSGSGLAPSIDIGVVPGSVTFGDVRINTDSTPTSVDVRNFGGATLSVSSATVSAGYVLSGPSAFTVGAFGFETLAVTCQPTMVGPMAGTLTINSNDPDEPTVTVPLSCNGIDSNLAITPSPAVIAATRVGEPITETIQVINYGGAETVISAVALADAAPGIVIESAPASGTVVLAMGVVEVKVRFDATTAGDASATLNVTTTEGVRSSQISARALVASMSLSPDGAIDFGPVCAGKSATRPVTVLDIGDGEFQLTAVSSPELPFSLAPLNLPVTILALGANQVGFDLTASPIDVGTMTTSITINTDIPNGLPRVIELAVTGLPDGVTATPPTLDLGVHELAQTTIGQAVTLTNCGAAPIVFSNPRIEGTDLGDFAIVSQPTSTTLAGAASASWLVVFNARTVGAKTAQFVVDHPAGSSAVNLVGEGLGALEPLPTAVDPRSYYSCSTGAGTALWPLAFALAFAARRKRRAR